MALVGGGAWYTSPVWMKGAASDEQLLVTNALASRDLVGLGHVDVDRGLMLQERLFGAPDAKAMLAPDENFWDSLSAAGIDPGSNIDDAVAALYADDTSAEGSYWAAALIGRFDADSVRQWIAGRYDVDRFDADTATIYFSWLDEQTCEPAPLHAARIGPTRVLVTDAAHIETFWSRIESAAPADVPVDDWLAMTGEQLLTIGVMNPAGMGHGASGMAGMMLAAAGQAAQPAEALYFGIAPALMPPGVVFTGAITSNDTAFLDMTNTAATSWLAEAKSKTADNPDVLSLIERVSFSLEARTFTAGIRLDTNVDEEIQTLLNGVMQQSMGVSSSGPGMAMEDQVDEGPFQFGSASAASMPSFDQFGTNAFFTPQWQDGPFAVGVSRLTVAEAGSAQLTIRGEARGLPNLGERAKLVRMRISDVADTQGNSLLPARECGSASSREWSDAGLVTKNSYFDDSNNIRYYPMVSFEKEFALADDASVADVESIRGEVEFDLPVQTRSIRVDMPVDGEVVETDDLRIVFRGGSENEISYQLSGDINRLLDVRALNAAGQVLRSGGSSSTGSWFGSGQNASIDIYGTIATVELIVADQTETLTYAFELDSAYPGFDSEFSFPTRAFEVADAQALAGAMQLDAPEPSFDWNQPVATAKAGPVFVAVQDFQASSFMGLYTQLELYVADGIPLADHLNGGAVHLETVALADGSTVPISLSSPVGLSTDGGYWRDGTFVPDPDRPWLKGGANLQFSDYENDMPVTLNGRVVFRAPVETQTSVTAAFPGSRLDQEGVELTVAEWRPGSIEIDIQAGEERILSIEVLDADDNVIGRADNISVGFGSPAAHISNLRSAPESLRVVIATESAEHDVPFAVDLAGIGEGQAGM